MTYNTLIGISKLLNTFTEHTPQANVRCGKYQTHLLFLNQTLQKEIQGHQPRIDDILRRGKTQSQLDGDRQSVLEERLIELEDLWGQLIAETDKRHARLMEANRAQQFYADAAEAEAWMGEQELHMMSEEKAKVRRDKIGRRIALTLLSVLTKCDNLLCLFPRMSKAH